MHASLGGFALLHAGVGLDWDAWVWEPGVVIPLLLSAALYARGVSALRANGARRAIRPWEIACFATGWLVVLLSLVSPLHGASEQLFSAHMVQHELLMTLAAPLLVLGRPLVVMLWALPRSSRLVVGRGVRAPIIRRGWHALSRPFDAWLIHGAAIWLWHLPPLFQATLTSELVHALQHASFLGSALLFWWTLIHPARRAARGLSIIYLFTTAVHTGVLGALMAFARTPWYPRYASGAAAWGLTPMSDQQLAGLIMWIPASAAYLVAALLIMRQWLSDSEWRVTQRERAAAAIPLS